MIDFALSVLTPIHYWLMAKAPWPLFKLAKYVDTWMAKLELMQE